VKNTTKNTQDQKTDQMRDTNSNYHNYQHTTCKHYQKQASK